MQTKEGLSLQAGRRIRGRWQGAFVVLVGFAFACSAPEPTAISLVERFPNAVVENAVEPGEPPPPIQWRFDGQGSVEWPEEAPAATFGWRALNDVDNLRVEAGLLLGQTGEVSLLAAAAPTTLDSSDILYAVEVRMRVSEGTQFGIGLVAGEDLERMIDQAKRGPLLSLNTDLVIGGGDELQTYTLTGANARIAPSYALSRIQHVVIRPSDVAGADFAIESVRLISRKEHLATLKSGVGWEGLGDIFRETVVARSPERLVFTLDIPSDPFLELEIGTVEEGPLTFTVDVDDRNVLRRTVTRPRLWHKVLLDLTNVAGSTARLTLGLEAEAEGTIGFWGGATIRNRAGSPTVGEASAARQALGAPAAPPKGVILILADTLRRDHLELYGHHRANAPVLSRLASEGALFEDAIAQGSWTKISVASILTSLYPATHGLLDMPDRLPASVTTLAEAYRNAGYTTFATSSVPFTGKLTNLHQGVEVLHERPSITDLEPTSAKTARTFVDRLLDWLEDHHQVPFFAFLHIFDPHSPFEPLEPHASKWMDADTVAAFRKDMETVAEKIDSPFMKLQSLPNQIEMDASGVDQETYLEREKIWYDASILAMDIELGRLMERLEELGIADDVLIAFVSDHGEEFLEHGRSFHGANPYGEHANVPLLIRWPGAVPAGLRIPETVQTIDLYPTLLELSRVPVNEKVQGQSLLPLFGDPERRVELGWRQLPAFTERMLAPGAFEEDEIGQVESLAMVSEGWKLVKNLEFKEGTRNTWELYDHVEDPLNLNDIAEDNPEVVERLAKVLEDWHAQATAQKVEPDDDADLSAEELNRLRALGYVN